MYRAYGTPRNITSIKYLKNMIELRVYGNSSRSRVVPGYVKGHVDRKKFQKAAKSNARSQIHIQISPTVCTVV